MPLVLTRRIGEVLHIGDDVKVEVKGFKGRQVQLAIHCPRSMEVLRGELYEKPRPKPKPEPEPEAASEWEFNRWWVAEYGQPPGPEHTELVRATRLAWLDGRRARFTEHSYADLRAQIHEANPDALFFESPDYDRGLIGMTEDGRAVYDEQLCIGSLVDEETTWEDASDFFSYNTVRSLPYEDIKVRPIIVSTIP